MVEQCHSQMGLERKLGLYQKVYIKQIRGVVSCTTLRIRFILVSVSFIISTMFEYQIFNILTFMILENYKFSEWAATDEHTRNLQIE